MSVLVRDFRLRVYVLVVVCFEGGGGDCAVDLLLWLNSVVVIVSLFTFTRVVSCSWLGLLLVGWCYIAVACLLFAWFLVVDVADC